MFSVVKSCIYVFMLYLQVVNVVFASSVENHDVVAGAKYILENTRGGLQATADARIAMYNKLFPEILFVQLAGGVDVPESLMVLQVLLGHEADNLDYEHGPESREDLLLVNVSTIIMMLEQNASSATLFRVGVNSLAERNYMCVITLTPEEAARDDVMATRDLMLNVSEQEFAQVDTTSYLNHLDYMKFIIDHEAYHCLDSFYNGPRPKMPIFTDSRWGGYMDYHHHQGADMFSLAMYIRDNDGGSAFVRKIGNLRALAILYGDPNHYSYPAIQGLLSLDPKTIMAASRQELFRLSSNMRDEVMLDYAGYLKFTSSSREVMNRLRGKSEIQQGIGVIENEDKSLQELLEIVQHSYKEIFGSALVVPADVIH